MAIDLLTANTEYLFDHGFTAASNYPSGFLRVLMPAEERTLVERLAFSAANAADAIHYEGYVRSPYYPDFEEFAEYYRSDVMQKSGGEIRPANRNICIKPTRQFALSMNVFISSPENRGKIGFQVQHRNRYSDSGIGPARIGQIFTKMLQEVDFKDIS